MFRSLKHKSEGGPTLMNTFQPTMLLFVLLIGLSTCSGCTQSQTEGTGTSAPAPIHIEPVVVDLGEVALSMESLDFTFDLRNASKETQRVEITAGCGCTAIDQAQVSIPAGASHTVKASLSLRGRIGDFHSSIHVDSQSGDSSHRNQTASLPIHAWIVDLWRAVPQRVILESGGEGTVSVSAPPAAWVGVSTEKIGQDFDFEQTSANTLDAVETRVFRVTSKPGENHGGNCGIGLRHDGVGHAVFTVPVLVK